MAKQIYRPRVDTPKDVASFVLFGAAAVALCAGAGFFVGSAAIAIAAFAVSTLISFPLLSIIFRMMYEGAPSAENSQFPAHSQDIPAFVKNLSELIGFNKLPIVQIFRANSRHSKDFAAEDLDFKNMSVSDIEKWLDKIEKESAAPKSDFKRAAEELFNDLFSEYPGLANAAAYGRSHHGIVITDPLLKTLNSNESRIVVAHEVGHIAANHLLKTSFLTWVTMAATLMASFYLIGAIFSSWAAFGVFIASAVVAAIVRGLLTRYAGYDTKHRRRYPVQNAVISAFGTATIVGMSAFLGMPHLMMAGLLSWGVGLSAELLMSGFARRAEYQADRIAAEATRDPLSLCTALDKLEEHGRKLMAELFPDKVRKSGKKKKPSLLDRQYAAARNVFQSHPLTKNRIARLQRMEKRFRAEDARQNRRPDTRPAGTAAGGAPAYA